MDAAPASRTPLRLSLPPAAPPAPSLDEVQARAAAWPADAGHLLVVGAPGTGKTTTAIEAFLARAASAPTAVPGGAAGGDQGVLMLVPTRRGAARVRDAVAARLGRTTTQVMVRTPASFAYSVLRLRAALVGAPPPTLITGPEQDQVLGELLAGHRAGVGAHVGWPASIGPETLALGAFRDELRDLFMRAAELGLGPEELAERGRRYGRAEWVAAAALLQEYQDVTALGEMTPDRGARLDAARIVDEATAALRAWEAEVPGHPRPRWSAVVVDDHQDSTLAAARLLRVLAEDGAQLLLHGDPDAGVQGFRGGTPALVARAETTEPLGGFGATRLDLPTVHRGHAGLRRAAATVTAAVSTLGAVRHRRAAAAERRYPDGLSHGVEAAVLRSGAQEGAFIARRLREERLHHGTPWSQMAVVVRSSGDLTRIQRMLRSWGVPAGGTAAPGVLRDDPAVRPLLVALRTALTGRVEAEEAVELLTSPLGALDAVSLRALRRTVRGWERARGGNRPVEELLSELLGDPALAETLPAHVRPGALRVATVLAAGRTALAQDGVTAETALWALWHASGLAEPWRERALAGGAGAERADAALDAVMALFKAAERYTDRTVGGGPAGFLDHLTAQDLPADSLAARGVRPDAVQVLTPAAAAGEEWAIVVAAGLQEDVWPDLRLRDSLLGAGALADVEAGRSLDGRRALGPARRQVLDDELRMLAVAVSRATRRLIVTAVLDEDQRPSSFFDLLAPDDAATEELVRAAPPALDLRGLVAELRCVVEAEPAGPEDAGRRRAAAALLAHLADQGVEGADPAEWAGLAPVSTDAPLRPPGEPVPVSPSAVEQATSCALRWALEQAGGRGERSLDQSVGSLVHEIAAEHPHGTAEEMHAALDARWPGLGLGEGWVGARQRQLADAMIDRLAAYVATVPGDVDVEREFTADVGRAHLTGRMDRVERLDDGRVRVVDLKTSASPVSKEKAAEHAQLGAYQAAVDAGAFGGAASAGGRLVYLGTGKAAALRPQPALTDAEDPRWAERLVTEAAEAMAGSTFLARQNEQCQHCPVRTSCPLQDAGRRVTG
ncbi:PD-(D/E)XK nuclease family protein [Georgenia sp. AZ-5]|uniref:PD-(D/E)XK nuclease family protein n=1 Tax=Georgenia sp. AZ-5 TaxID=3367526 RepID=UPI003754EE7B